MASYEEVEKELEKIDSLIEELKEKKRQLRRVQEKFKLPHYCPFCGSENIVKPPEVYRGPSVWDPNREETYLLKGYYYCRGCDRGFKLSLMSRRKKEIVKEAILK